jgi:hypothetical protein
MPGRYGLRFHDDQGIGPARSPTAEGNPEQSIQAPQLGPRLFPLEHDQLLAKSGDLQTEAVARDQKSPKVGDYGEKEPEHPSNFMPSRPAHAFVTV